MLADHPTAFCGELDLQSLYLLHWAQLETRKTAYNNLPCTWCTQRPWCNCVLAVLVLECTAADLMFEGTANQLGQGVQEGSFAKAGVRAAALSPLGQHGGLPGGDPIHASPSLADPARLLADDAHAAIPVSLHQAPHLQAHTMQKPTCSMTCTSLHQS